MSIGIVVVNNRPEIYMSWQTNNGEAEAKRMVAWLKDHGIRAMYFTSISEWNA